MFPPIEPFVQHQLLQMYLRVVKLPERISEGGFNGSAWGVVQGPIRSPKRLTNIVGEA